MYECQNIIASVIGIPQVEALHLRIWQCFGYINTPVTCSTTNVQDILNLVLSQRSKKEATVQCDAEEMMLQVQALLLIVVIREMVCTLPIGVVSPTILQLEVRGGADHTLATRGAPVANGSVDLADADTVLIILILRMSMLLGVYRRSILTSTSNVVAGESAGGDMDAALGPSADIAL